jgi:hypothetical protein
MARNVTDSVRRSLELHPRTALRLDRMRDALEAASDTEVVRRALQVLEALIEDEKAGKTLQVRDRATGEITSVSVRYAGADLLTKAS